MDTSNSAMAKEVALAAIAFEQRMDRARLLVLISVFVGAIALAFYMDWLGLWVSTEEMKKEIARSKARMLAIAQTERDS